MSFSQQAAAVSSSPDDPEALDRAIRYSREREKLWLVSTGAGLAVNVVSVVSGMPTNLSIALRQRVPPSLHSAAFILTWSTQDALIRLPLAYHGGYVVEQRYGLSNHTRKGWLAEYAKGFILGIALNTPVFTTFYALVRRYPERWWLVASALAVPFTVLAAGLYPILIAPVFNKYEPVDDSDLESRVRNLSEREGVQVSQVLRMDMSRQTSKTNAFFSGLGKTKRIVLADTLLERFSADEIEVVVAHELAHQVHRDTWKLIGLSGIATFGGAYALHRLFPWAVRRTRSRTGVAALGDVASLPLVELVTGIFGLCSLPLANAFIRRLERSADAYAVRLTGKPGAFISAMKRLQQTNLADPDPPALVRLLLHSHPPIGERIRWAQQQLH